MLDQVTGLHSSSSSFSYVPQAREAASLRSKAGLDDDDCPESLSLLLDERSGRALGLGTVAASTRSIMRLTAWPIQSHCASSWCRPPSDQSSPTAYIGCCLCDAIGLPVWTQGSQVPAGTGSSASSVDLRQALRPLAWLSLAFIFLPALDCPAERRDRSFSSFSDKLCRRLWKSWLIRASCREKNSYVSSSSLPLGFSSRWLGASALTASSFKTSSSETSSFEASSFEISSKTSSFDMSSFETSSSARLSSTNITTSSWSPGVGVALGISASSSRSL
mmetsp:Transcript_108660/g.242379  ORF Transcript_108660/g.242379 Transcript_108660/m.242379 type:complete len:277 (-) Transcript_108660:249-1079(-)